MFSVEGFDKPVSWCGRGSVYRLFELRYECVEYGGGGWVPEEGSIEEVSAFEDYAWVSLFHESIQAIRRSEVLHYKY